MNITPRKRFGQNFLKDTQLIQRIVRAIDPKPNEHFIEIGPGQGALTQYLLPLVGRLDAIEIDRDLIVFLTEKFSEDKKFHLLNSDALECNLQNFILNDKIIEKSSLRIVGNLPYNISTPLIFHLLTQTEYILDMHFMLQKEVVDRIVAKPGNKIYGRLSVMVQYHCLVKRLFLVPPTVFYPQPKVDSAIISLHPHKNLIHRAKNYSQLSELVRKAFCQRRKTLRNALKDDLTEGIEEKLSFSLNARAEELSVENFVELENALNS